jgi:hypothetical protein
MEEPPPTPYGRTMSDGPEWRLTGRLRVGLAPEEAFRLFTPLGEQEWVPGWRPRFPVPVGDDTVPGTVFQTGAEGETVTWIVLEADRPRHIRYARVAPHLSAGTVAVTLGRAEGGSEVTVTYELTALNEPARPQLGAFAAEFPAYLRSWQDAIEAGS